MSKQKKRKRKYNPRKTLDSVLIGTVISWADTSPLSTDGHSITNDDITHTNPLLCAHAKAMILSGGKYILNEEVLLWCVTMTVVAYHAETKKEWREIREMESRCCLMQLEKHSLEQIQDAINYIGDAAEYERTEFECRVLGR